MKLTINIPRKLSGRVKLPPSKSVSNRMLIINELAGRTIVLDNVSDCDDTFVMRRALDERTPVTDIMAAGTSMRFLTAYFASTESDTVITGTERMRCRPIGLLVDALRSLGASVTYTEAEGFPPLHVEGRRLEGGEVELPGNVSSQYVSALLMVAPTMTKGLCLRLTGEVVSRPYLNITLCLMRQFGIEIDEPDSRTFIVKPGRYSGGRYLIENDWSGASYWYEMLALAEEGEVVLEGLFANSLQGDSVVSRLFEPLGIKTTYEGNDVVLAKTGNVTGCYEADLTSCPDLAQTMVATCCGLGVNFRFCGLQSLRIKETDRLLALRQELEKLGFVVQETDGSILQWNGERTSAQPNPAIDTYEDHRMAMCMAPLASIGGLLTINNPHVVSKSYPAYWNDLTQVGAIISMTEWK